MSRPPGHARAGLAARSTRFWRRSSRVSVADARQDPPTRPRGGNKPLVRSYAGCLPGVGPFLSGPRTALRLPPLRILLPNDDGTRAPGIIALYDALTATPFGASDDVFPIAPLTVQSATGHGVTVHAPLMTAHVQVNDRMAG